MDSENRHGVSSVLEMAGVCQSSRCCGACVNVRVGFAQLLSNKLLTAARTTTAPAIDASVRSVNARGLSGRSKV
jgi:hypothetical protein